MGFWDQYADTNNESLGRCLFYLDYYGMPLTQVEQTVFHSRTENDTAHVTLYGEVVAYIHWICGPLFTFVGKYKHYERVQESKRHSAQKYEKLLTAQRVIRENAKTINRIVEGGCLLTGCFTDAFNRKLYELRNP